MQFPVSGQTLVGSSIITEIGSQVDQCSSHEKSCDVRTVTIVYLTRCKLLAFQGCH